MAIKLTSEAFDQNERIPKKYTGEGKDVSPSLEWTGLPGQTKQLAMIMDDPDAPREDPWVHWVIYNIPADIEFMQEGVATRRKLSEPEGAAQGENSWGNIGYGGPMPPPGHGVHHYHFKLYALDSRLDLKPGLSKKQLLNAMRAHVLAHGELIGTYER
jgi:hypothetical protein